MVQSITVNSKKAAFFRANIAEDARQGGNDLAARNSHSLANFEQQF
jgi:hypothetical protein